MGVSSGQGGRWGGWGLSSGQGDRSGGMGFKLWARRQVRGDGG